MILPSELTVEALADRTTRGPRYTSYPPATELAPIEPEIVARELATIAVEHEPVSLYVHVPFCRSLCAYCGCNVIPTRDTSRGDGYVDDVITELAILAGGLGVGFPVTELALGGGSPNFLEPRAIRRLVTAVCRYFEPTPDIRMSVELDPRTTTTSHLETFGALGFRSLSIGVQDFDTAVQDAIRRHQSIVQTRWLVERSRAIGFDDLNVDLVYGLPRQTEESFDTTLDAVIGFAPDRIALFGYAHLPDKLPHQRLVERAGRVLDRYERATLLLMAIDRLTSAGYVHLGLDHFARPDSRLARAAAEQRMVRTFQGYVERRSDSVVGVGVSAISSTPRVFWQAPADLARWRAELAAGRLPIARGVALDPDDRIRRAIIGKLMCDGEVTLTDVCREHAIDPSSYFAHELAALSRLGDLATYDPATQVIRTTPMGRLLVRNVCMVFDRYQHRSTSGAFSSTL